MARARRQRRRQPQHEAQSRKLASVATLTVAVLAPLALGGATPITASLICLGALIAAAASSVGSRLPVTGPVIFFGVAVAWTSIQALPLPPWLVEWISPLRFASIAPTLALTSGPSWAPLSLDPGGTHLALLHAVTIACGLILGCTVAPSRKSLRPIRIAASSCAAMALVVVMHEVAGVHTVFGIYEPVDASPHPMAPLMNPNHLAAFLAFGVPLQLLLAFKSKGNRRHAWITAAALGASLIPFTGSRAGMASLVIGVLILLASVWKRLNTKARLWSAAAVSLFGAGVVVVGTLLVEKLQRGDLSKLSISADALGLGMQFPIAGVGRGAFAPAFAQMTTADVRPMHVENLPVHWIVEWGFPFALVGFVVLGGALLAGFRKGDIATRVCAGALLALVIHDFVDYSLELPAVAFVVAIVFGAMVRRLNTGTGRTRPDVWVGVLAVVAALAFAAGAESPAHATDRLLLGPEALSFDVSQASRRHPLEPGVAMAAARQRMEGGHDDAIRWINRSMQLAPTWPGPHELAASWLARRGAYGQALLEVREAESTGRGRAYLQACEWVTSGRIEPQRLVRALPDDSEQERRMFDSLLRCLREPSHLEVLDEIAAERGIESLGVVIRRSAALAPAERVAYLAPLGDEEPIQVARAEALLELGRPADSLRSLREPEEASWRALALRAKAAAQVEDPQHLNAVFQALDGRFGQSSDGFVRVARVKMQAFEAAGRTDEALETLLGAGRAQPDSRLDRMIVRAAHRYSQPHRANQARRALCNSGNETFCPDN